MPSSRPIDWAALAGSLAPRVRPETRSKYFPNNPLRQALLSGFLDQAAQMLSGFAWSSLLDLGCGEGFCDYYLGQRFPGRKITGVDMDPEALAVAQAINPGFPYLVGDGRSLPFPDGSFDAVICFEVLEHLKDFPAVIREARRVASGPGLFSVPARPWYQASNFLIGKNWRRLGEHPDHVVQFTGRRLRAELTAVFGPGVTVRLAFPWLLARAG